MKRLYIVGVFMVLGFVVNAQNSDSLQRHNPNSHYADSLSRRNANSQYSIFGNSDTITRNDYLLSIEKVFQALNQATVLSQPIPSILEISENLTEDDSAIAIIRDKINANDKSLGLRNLQMLSIILKQINSTSKTYAEQLNQYDSLFDSIKVQILEVRKDTLLKRIFHNPDLRDSFSSQLVQMRGKWKKTDSLMKYVSLLIANTQAATSDNLIITNELQLQAQTLMETTGRRIFGKESDYLWQFKKRDKTKTLGGELKKSVHAERKIANYYFSHTHNLFLLLLFCGLLFFFWAFFNYKSLKKLGRLDTLESFHFRYIKSFPIFSSLIVMLNLAPLFDLDAPFIYIATIEFLLMLTLTYSFWKRLPRNLFYAWLLFIVLFFFVSLSRYLRLPDYFNRWLVLVLNILSVLLGLYIVSTYKMKYKQHKVLLFSVGLYIVLNSLAIICNLFGRVTLTQIFGSTGTYAFIQTAGLIVFVMSVTEAFLLQIHSSRMRKDYNSDFDHEEVGKGIGRLVIFFSVIIWLVVFATNLNIYDFIAGRVSTLLSKIRTIGSFSFTYSGVILFIVILYAANLLQKHIGYFFGNIGDEAIFDNRGTRSRLMILKLVLLVAGFLLAVAASGLAIDKITVILGALSVGIGLGLQNIVNNFVSGIILIFDRTLHIGDTVEIGDKKGRVRQISMRSSTLLTPEGAEVIIPNGYILSQNFVNWSLNENYIRVDLSYTVEKMTSDIREGILKIIKSSPEVVGGKEPEILISTITSQSTQLKIYFWCEDVTKREQARSEVNTAVSNFLEEKEIKIL